MLHNVVHRRRRHVEVNDRRVLEPRVGDVPVDEADPLPLALPPLLVREADQGLVELDADGAAAEAPRDAEGDAAVAAAEVHEEVVLCQALRQHLSFRSTTFT